MYEVNVSTDINLLKPTNGGGGGGGGGGAFSEHSKISDVYDNQHQFYQNHKHIFGEAFMRFPTSHNDNHCPLSRA